jgi:SAM-dependent methyltransferase
MAESNSICFRGGVCRVSNVPSFAESPVNGVVLDLGCGAGLDSLLLARRMGNGGRVIGVDFSWAMLERALPQPAALGTCSFARLMPSVCRLGMARSMQPSSMAFLTSTRLGKP